MSDCLFCKIVNKEIPAKLIYEDEDAVAFDDINPQAPVHFLVIPKKHTASVYDLKDEQLLGKLLMTAARLAEERELDSGYRIVTNKGADAGQSVFHLHIHVLGGRRMGWPPG